MSTPYDAEWLEFDDETRPVTARHDKAPCDCKDGGHDDGTGRCLCGGAIHRVPVGGVVHRVRDETRTATHDKATEGRTEAAAVDQAIADVDALVATVRNGLYSSPGGGPSGNREAADAALRVLADAVEELRGDRDEAERLYDEAEQRLTAMEAERDHWRELTEAREDENVRLAAQVESLRSWIKDSQDYKRAERLARQVADLEAQNERFARHIARPRFVNGQHTGGFLYSHGSYSSCQECIEARDIVRAALAKENQ